MSELVNQKCVACRGGEPTLTEAEINKLKPQVPEWQVRRENGENQLSRTFKFKNFRQALQFTNQVGEIAEEQDHHPLLQTEWGKVSVAWWTHKIGGLHQNDFIMAAKTDEIYRKGWTAQ
jgi:4a-hydroxytetrahydrobiopterin dehydratase